VALITLADKLDTADSISSATGKASTTRPSSAPLVGCGTLDRSLVVDFGSVLPVHYVAVPVMVTVRLQDSP
jgi:hypothetical protein